MRTVALITDFGTQDWYVAAVKAEILKRTSAVRFLDITHEIPAYDVTAAAFVLKMVAPSLPQRTIVLAVVDPGVGGPRRGLTMFSGGIYWFAPDNGILSLVARPDAEFRYLDAPRTASATFHARDVFAPAVGRLARGTPFARLGRPATGPVRLDIPRPRVRGDVVSGEVIYVDRFGTMITNIPVDRELNWLEFNHRRVPVVPCYEAVPAGSLAGIRGSSGYYEIAGNRSDAQELTAGRVGMPVRGRKNLTLPGKSL